MDERIDLTPLFPLQRELDEDIASRHQVTYQSTFHKRLLALLVELGEFANETRCFKYWSLKGPSEKEKILDEYADGLHFFLSLGIPLGEVSYSHRYEKSLDLTEQLLLVYAEVAELNKHYDPKRYEKAFGHYLDIIPLLGFTSSEAIDAYKKKLGTNHARQENAY